MENQIQAGDVVQLKSGGAKMTVIKIDGEKAEVVWMDKDNNTTYREFPLVALKRYEEPNLVSII